jgi:hypothetical protein
VKGRDLAARKGSRSKGSGGESSSMFSKERRHEVQMI